MIGDTWIPTSEQLEVGRKAVEDQLVTMRDERMFIIGHNNGLVIKERDGRDSNIIRLNIITALSIAIKAMQEVKL